MEKYKFERAQEILSGHHNEFSLLQRYTKVPLAELQCYVGEDYECIKSYVASEEGNTNAKASTFEDFLKEFLFYIQGGGYSWPANFHYIDYTWNGKKLSEEMVRVYAEIVAKSNGEETAGD